MVSRCTTGRWFGFTRCRRTTIPRTGTCTRPCDTGPARGINDYGNTSPRSAIASAPVLADVVVLSACETFSGPLYRGEGVVGLARAFLMSGATTVVATQWPVGPPNVELMRAFYREVARGTEMGPALSRAKREMRNRAGTAHPLFWAGTILIGS